MHFRIISVMVELGEAPGEWTVEVFPAPFGFAVRSGEPIQVGSPEDIAINDKVFKAQITALADSTRRY